MVQPERCPGSAVVAALLLAIGTALVSAVTAAALGRSWWQALAASAAVPMLLSAVLASAALVWSATSTAVPPDEPAVIDLEPDAAPAPSEERRAAELAVVAAERELERTISLDADGGCAETSGAATLALYEARLALARICLLEDGRIAEQLKNELIVHHRGITQLLGRTPDRQA